MSIPPEKNGSRSSISYWFAAGTISRISWRSAKAPGGGQGVRFHRVAGRDHRADSAGNGRKLCVRRGQQHTDPRSGCGLCGSRSRETGADGGSGRKKASLKEAAALKSPSPRLTPNPSVLLPGSPRPKIRRKKAQFPEIWKAPSTGKQAVSAEEDGRIPYQQTDRVSEGSGGATKHNDAYERERYDHAAEDIERLLDKMAEKAACEQLENERTRELNDVARASPMEMSMPVLISVEPDIHRR